MTNTWQPDPSDLYPSRNQERARLIERKDPVIYAERSQWGDGPLSPEQLDAYERDGFLVLENFFSSGEVETMQAELERLRHELRKEAKPEVITEPESGDVRSIFQIHSSSPTFQAIAQDPRLVRIAAFLLQDEVYIHQSRINYKPGFRGKEFYWHSDFETWHVEDGMPRMRALSMSIGLTDNETYNGPLMLVPGSHQKFVVCEGETPEQNFKMSLKKQEVGVPSDDQLAALVETGGIVPALGKAGSLTIFDCNTMHGSNGNITPAPRSNAFLVYNAMSNKLVTPYSGQWPRPECIATREDMSPVSATLEQ